MYLSAPGVACNCEFAWVACVWTVGDAHSNWAVHGGVLQAAPFEMVCDGDKGNNCR